MGYTFHMYVLRCADWALYVGHTDNIERRLSEHGLGLYDGYTKTRRPVHLAYSEEYSTRDEPFHRERQVNGWSRAKKEALIRADDRALARLLAMERTGLRRLRFDDWGTDVGQGGEVALRQAQDERAWGARLEARMPAGGGPSRFDYFASAPASRASDPRSE